MSKAIPFHVFCKQVLKLGLTPAQEVLARCAFGDENPEDLPEDLRDLGSELFGGAMRFPYLARSFVTLTLGRGSGKTTLSGAYAIYSSLTANLSAARHGAIPVFPLMSFDKSTAGIAMNVVRGLLTDANLKRYIISEKHEEIMIKRPHDMKVIGIKVHAAAPQGRTIRGRPIIGMLLDEAQFVSPDDSGRYVVTDVDQISAATPRLLPGGKIVLISTPWPTPVPTVMRETHEKNYGSPQTAISALATTLQMRGDDPEVREMVEREFQRDPERAMRELECDDSKTSAGGFFDVSALRSSVDPGYPHPRGRLWACAVGVDLAFRRDSTAIVVVQWDGHHFIVSRMEELRPTRDQAVKPSDAFKLIAEVCRDYKVPHVIADGHYREAIREFLRDSGIGIINAPEGILGKEIAYARTRTVLHQGMCKIPDDPRFIHQATTIVARPTAGGHISIKSPRSKGSGHGDLISAWVNAVHYLAHARLGVEKDVRLKPSDPGYWPWRRRLEQEAIEKQEERYLKKEEQKLKGREKWREKAELLRQMKS